MPARLMKNPHSRQVCCSGMQCTVSGAIWSRGGLRLLFFTSGFFRLLSVILSDWHILLILSPVQTHTTQRFSDHSSARFNVSWWVSLFVISPGSIDLSILEPVKLPGQWISEAISSSNSLASRSSSNHCWLLAELLTFCLSDFEVCTSVL